VKFPDRLVIVKTSPKVTLALLAILALGGSTAGSLFAESLQTKIVGSIGTAGAFFPDREISTPVQQVVADVDKTTSVVDKNVVALPIEASPDTSVPVVETQVRAITSLEELATPVPTPESLPTPEPTSSPEPTPESLPTPEPTSSPEPSPEPTPEIEPLLPQPEFE
jgi:hypothetical protein